MEIAGPLSNHRIRDTYCLDSIITILIVDLLKRLNGLYNYHIIKILKKNRKLYKFF